MFLGGARPATVVGFRERCCWPNATAFSSGRPHRQNRPAHIVPNRLGPLESRRDPFRPCSAIQTSTGVSSIPTHDLGRQQREWRYVRHMQPPTFRVLLHNDNVNKSEYVVKVLLKVVDGLTLETASQIMQEVAEVYCQRLRGCGLRSSMEPVRPNFSGAHVP